MACTITGFKQKKWTFKLIDTNKVKDYSQETSPNLNAGYGTPSYCMKKKKFQ